MPFFNFFNLFFNGLKIDGSDRSDLIFGSFGDDDIAGKDGNDLIFGLFGDDNLSGDLGDDKIFGGFGQDTVEGGDGEDHLYGGFGNDRIVGNTGNDQMFGGAGDDLLVWNNGDGSDLMDGDSGYDQVQVNFDTDLVNDDLQNKDVAEFSVTDQGVQFARIEVNDQTERGLFQLDIRNTETLETNFGGGDDTAVIKSTVLDEIVLDLDGGDGVDLLNLSQVGSAVDVDLAAGTISDVRDVATGESPEGVISGSGDGVVDTSGSIGVPVNPDDIDKSALNADISTAVNFEQVTGTAFDDTIAGNDQNNVIRGGAGNDVMSGGEGADTFVFFEEDAGVDIILDFDFGEDSLLFLTTDPDVTTENLLANLTQVGDDVELALNNKVITFEDVQVTEFYADDFMIA